MGGSCRGVHAPRDVAAWATRYRAGRPRVPRMSGNRPEGVEGRRIGYAGPARERISPRTCKTANSLCCHVDSNTQDQPAGETQRRIRPHLRARRATPRPRRRPRLSLQQLPQPRWGPFGPAIRARQAAHATRPARELKQDGSSAVSRRRQTRRQAGHAAGAAGLPGNS